jgi:hypothetical protein
MAYLAGLLLIEMTPEKFFHHAQVLQNWPISNKIGVM